MIAHLTAFWHGDMDGPAFWLTLAGIGIPLIAVFLVALVKLADWSLTRWPGDLGSDPDDIPPTPTVRHLDELAPLDATERRARARFTSLIAVLGLIALPVVALTR